MIFDSKMYVFHIYSIELYIWNTSILGRGDHVRIFSILDPFFSDLKILITFSGINFKFILLILRNA